MLLDEIPSSFRDKTSELAIHNPHYRQQSRVRKGRTDITVDVSSNFMLFWWNSFYVDVHIYKLTGRLMLYSKDVWTSALWKNLKNSSLASDEKILELGWCDWCFTAEKSVPVRSDEECTFQREIPCRVQNYLDWSFLWFPLLVLERRYYGDCSWKFIEDSFKTKDMDKNSCK